MSYLTSKHPGLALYLALICISCLSLLFMDAGTQVESLVIGTLSVFWGLFIMMRILALYEVNEHLPAITPSKLASKTTNAISTALAHDLTHRMRRNDHFKRGLLALTCLNPRTLIWLVLSLTYVGLYLYTSAEHASLTTHIQNISLLFIIGAAFWAGQSYAYSDQASKIICATIGCVFVFGIMTLWPYDTLVNFDHVLQSTLQSPASLSLAALALYSIAILLYAGVTLKHGVLYAMTGLSFVLFIGFSYIALDPAAAAQNAALWISGWALVSIFWVRSFSNVRKTYVLYQGQ